MNQIIYSLETEDVQNEAKAILGRKLNDEELSQVVELIQYGLGENLMIMYRNIFNDIEERQKK